MKLVEVETAKEFAHTFLGDPILKLAVKAVLENAPTADAVVVTRCEHCQRYDPGYVRPNCGWCNEFDASVRADGFCYKAKPKEGA